MHRNIEERLLGKYAVQYCPALDDTPGQIRMLGCHDCRRHEYGELCFVMLKALRPEQRTQDRYIAQAWDLVDVARFIARQKAGKHQRLPRSNIELRGSATGLQGGTARDRHRMIHGTDLD